MPKQLSVDAQTILNLGQAPREFHVDIDGTINTDAIDWNYSYDDKYGSASLQVTIKNTDGKYSPGGTNPIAKGSEVEVFEGIDVYGTPELFSKFYGKIDSINPNVNQGGSRLVLNVFDALIKLQWVDVDEKYESPKTKVAFTTTDTRIEGVEYLTPHYLSDDEDNADFNMAAVFDLPHTNIALKPVPNIRVTFRGSAVAGEKITDITIDNEYGQIILNAPINVRDDYDVIVEPYFYYPSSTISYAEDIITELMTKADFYGNNPYSLANDLTTTKNVEDGSITDTMVPNLSPEAVDVKIHVKGAITAISTTINTKEDTTDFDSAGYLKINNEIIQYSSKTDNSFVVQTRSALNTIAAAHDDKAILYQAYPTGQVWYLTYNNAISDLVYGNFTIPGIVVGEFNRFDKRYGKIILTTPPTGGTGATVTCDVDYSFYTIQATGIQISLIEFAAKNIDNRFDATNELRTLLAPNYIFRTAGTRKVWGSYLVQKVNEDYTVPIQTSLDYISDAEIYTRVKMYGQNEKPTNYMQAVDEDGNKEVSFADIGTYSATAENQTLQWTGDDISYANYKLSLADSNGKYYSPTILLYPTHPTVYFDGADISDNDIKFESPQITIKDENGVIKLFGAGETGEVDLSNSDPSGISTFLTQSHYEVHVGATKVSKDYPIKIYTKDGALLFTIGTGDANMDYFNGIWYAPASTNYTKLIQASFSDLYKIISADDVTIDYANAIVRISKDSNHFPDTTEGGPYFERNIFEDNPTAATITIGAPAGVPGGRSEFPPGKMVDGSINSWFTHIGVYATEENKEEDKVYVKYINFDLGGTRFISKIELDVGSTMDPLTRRDTGAYWVQYKDANNVWQNMNKVEVVASRFTSHQEIFPHGETDLFTTTWKANEEVSPVHMKEVRIVSRLIASRHHFIFPFTTYFYTGRAYYKEVRIVENTRNGQVTMDLSYASNNIIKPSTSAPLMIDGLRNTQLQVKFKNKPLSGTQFLIIDLGSIRKIRAIDMLSGFYYPFTNDIKNKLDLENRYTLEYSTDGVNYNSIASDATNFKIDGGEKISFEEEVLGEFFEARYIKIIIEELGAIEHAGETFYAVCLAELAIYGDTVLEGDASLIPTTRNTVGITAGDTTINVSDTSAFSATGTIYIDGAEAFNYTSITATSFVSTTDTVDDNHALDVRISQALETDNTLYDDAGLLPIYSDKVYKDRDVHIELSTQPRIDRRSKLLLREFQKNLEKVRINSLLAPHIIMGMTLRVIDTINNVNQNYFLEKMAVKKSQPTFILARYPG